PGDHTDSKGVRLASENYYQELLSAGVKIFEYEPTFIHTKIMIIDSTWSIIGSANQDNRSRNLNEENIFGVASSAFGSGLENVFLGDLMQSKEINLEEWKKRGMLEKLRELL